MPGQKLRLVQKTAPGLYSAQTSQKFHHYKQSVGIILSIIVTSWLLRLPFGDTYRKIKYIVG